MNTTNILEKWVYKFRIHRPLCNMFSSTEGKLSVLWFVKVKKMLPYFFLSKPLTEQCCWSHNNLSNTQGQDIDSISQQYLQWHFFLQRTKRYTVKAIHFFRLRSFVKAWWRNVSQPAYWIIFVVIIQSLSLILSDVESLSFTPMEPLFYHC